MDPNDANFVSLRAANIDFDLVSDRNASEEMAPSPERREGFIFGGFGDLLEEEWRI
jgi:hypothetical protein